MSFPLPVWAAATVAGDTGVEQGLRWKRTSSATALRLQERKS
jgi:hypothetical protein